MSEDEAYKLVAEFYASLGLPVEREALAKEVVQFLDRQAKALAEKLPDEGT